MFLIKILIAFVLVPALMITASWMLAPGGRLILTYLVFPALVLGWVIGAFMRLGDRP